jgi:hypothetical protein
MTVCQQGTTFFDIFSWCKKKRFCQQQKKKAGLNLNQGHASLTTALSALVWSA